uniref:Disintegrin and metalloproteinase domain-containing protein 11 n=1 Tax=Cacopsylla melanoneura TaxID=428564 RepID=A0A8D8SE29_9HEMI
MTKLCCLLSFVLFLQLSKLVLTAVLPKKEVDYTLDESIWNEENPVGEFERLLHEYRQNQLLIQNIASHFYQIIYPVQLKNHEKMGISTREVASKYPSRGSHDNYQSSLGTKGRSRTGKHFHRTSLLIKAFNHKFRLDLELNTQLLAPNIRQKLFLPNGAEQITTGLQDIEHCYYHGTVKDYPGAVAAFQTCSGVSGIIHVGNETFVIHPFYGGDLSKHPHVIFEATATSKKGCGNTNNWQWRMKPVKHAGFHAEGSVNTRYRRDVRDATKFIETALIIDKAFFDKRNGSTRTEVIHDAIQVANIADLYFRPLNTRVSVVYIEAWLGQDKIQVDRQRDVGVTIARLKDYIGRETNKVSRDTTQMLTGAEFKDGEAGMAVPSAICSGDAVGISVDANPYEPHLLGGTMAHMIGHNIGMDHDDGREKCHCTDWHGCIMKQSIMGLENVQPYKFSACSQDDYTDALQNGRAICLLNKPNELSSIVHKLCGNGVVDEDEDCDCGSIEECHEKDPCCDAITCKLKKESQCADGPCCDNCKLRPFGHICREAKTECDLPEWCVGDSGDCPADEFKKNGNPCNKQTGFCFNGFCPTVDVQCEEIWGHGGVAGNQACYDHFNSQGISTGNCGARDGHYVKCDDSNILCGTLHCKKGSRNPVLQYLQGNWLSTVIHLEGGEFECKAHTGPILDPDSGLPVRNTHRLPVLGLVRDGTPCGEHLICVNQTCTSVFPYMDQGRCPSNNEEVCSGRGTCTNRNHCFCEYGWSGPDCSIQVEVPTSIVPVNGETTTNSLEKQMVKKVTPYVNDYSTNTIMLVFSLMMIVGGIFVLFTTMALCYRSVVVHKTFVPCLRKGTTPPQQPTLTKKASKKYTNPEEDAARESANKILSFGQSRNIGDRVLYRHVNHTGSTSSTSSHFPDQRQLKRLGMSSGSEEDAVHSEEEAVSFIDLPPSTNKVPEKGILKKACPYGGIDPLKEKWSESPQSETLSQCDNPLTGGGGGETISEVERTLKSLNGYHEDILEALRNAAVTHGRAGPSSSTGASSSSEDLLRRSIAAAVECSYKRSTSQDKLCDGRGLISQSHSSLHERSPAGSLQRLHHRSSRTRVDADEDDDGGLTSAGPNPIRIRNLEDLMRQLEYHSSRHMSPAGSEDIRMSDPETERQYRIDTHTGPLYFRCPRGGLPSSNRDEDSTGVGGGGGPRLVYGRYRQPRPGSGAGSYHGGHDGEDSIYETADHPRSPRPPCPADTPDSESSSTSPIN